ncbi:MAG TPA: hypothetical protein PLX15_01575 [Candidatus Woesearchaeota archaeon]|jgi:hypothetical protein|nr:hypothetical protein [Candidatus Woesearchaeota archaeon]
MTQTSSLRGTIEFLTALGAFDVVFPFLLVFTLVYAVLERSKVLGEANNESKHNLNSMVAFVLAFFTIASAYMVEIITYLSQWVVLFVVIGVFFVFLIVTFNPGADSKNILNSTPAKIIGAILSIVIMLILFLTAVLKDSDLQGVANFFDWFAGLFSEQTLMTLGFLAFILFFIMIVTKGGGGGKRTSGSKTE